MIAEEFNNFIVSIGPQLASNISSCTSHMFYMNTVANSIFMPGITTIKVINVILPLKNRCAGWDDIHAYVMKRCIHVYIEPLIHIIDMSFKEIDFPFELNWLGWFQYSNLVIRVKLQTTDLFLFYLPSQRYLKVVCIII